MEGMKRAISERGLWLVAALGVASVLVALSPGRFFATDIEPRLRVARQLWAHGDVFLPGDRSSEGLVYVPSKQGSTSLYGIGQSLVLIPFDALGVALGRTLAVKAQWREAVEKLPILFLYIPLVGTLLWLLLARVLTLQGVGRREAFGVALLFQASTILWFYSQSSQEEALVCVLLLAAFACALQWRKTSGVYVALGMGVFSALALTVRMNSLFGLLPIAGVWLDTPRGRLRGFGWACVGALPAVGLLAAFSYWRFGSVLATGYDLARSQGMGVFWGAMDWREIVRLSLGPGKGLLFLSPTLLMAFLGFKRWGKESPFTAAATLVAMAVSLFVCAKILNNPEGSESWGARYQVHLLGFWILPFYYGWRSALERWPTPARTLAAVALLIQMSSIWAPTSMEYLQVEGDRIDREVITASWTQGQLPLRLRNLGDWIAGRSAADRVAEEPHRALFAEMENRFVPNFWGATYAKEIGVPWSWLISLVPVLFGGLGLFFLAQNPIR